MVYFLFQNIKWILLLSLVAKSHHTALAAKSIIASITFDSGVIGYTVRPNFRSGGPYSLREYGPPPPGPNSLGNTVRLNKKTQGTQAILTDAAKLIFVCEIHFLADFTGTKLSTINISACLLCSFD